MAVKSFLVSRSQALSLLAPKANRKKAEKIFHNFSKKDLLCMADLNHSRAITDNLDRAKKRYIKALDNHNVSLKKSCPDVGMRRRHFLYKGHTITCIHYSNSRANTHLPPIIFFGGGGLIFTSPEANRSFLMHLSQKTGISIIQPELNGAPEKSFPKPAQNAELAVAAIQMYSDSLEFSQKKFILAGYEAGAQLAAHVANWESSTTPEIVGLLLFSPLIEFSSTSDSLTEFEQCFYHSREYIDWLVTHTILSGDTSVDTLNRYLISQQKIRTGFPTTLIVNAEFDPLTSEAIRFADMLEHNGVNVAHAELAGRVFGYGEYPNIQEHTESVQEIADLLNLFLEHGIAETKVVVSNEPEAENPSQESEPIAEPTPEPVAEPITAPAIAEASDSNLELQTTIGADTPDAAREQEQEQEQEQKREQRSEDQAAQADVAEIDNRETVEASVAEKAEDLIQRTLNALSNKPDGSQPDTDTTESVSPTPEPTEKVEPEKVKQEQDLVTSAHTNALEETESDVVPAQDTAATKSVGLRLPAGKKIPGLRLTTGSARTVQPHKKSTPPTSIEELEAEVAARRADKSKTEEEAAPPPKPIEELEEEINSATAQLSEAEKNAALNTKHEKPSEPQADELADEEDPAIARSNSKAPEHRQTLKFRKRKTTKKSSRSMKL